MSKETQAKGIPGSRTMWLWIVAAFLLLIAAWTTLIVVAARNQPEIIEIEQP